MFKFDLSVVIITRNRLSKLKRCIDSVRSNLTQLEIVVVDNGSTDGTIEYLKSNNFIKSIFLSYNRGVAGARNIGIENSSGRFVMLLDDDAWIDELPFDEIVKYMKSNQNVGLVAPRLLYPDGRIQESIRSFPTILALIWRGFGLYKIFPNFRPYRNYINHDYKSTHKIDWSIGACQIIRCELFSVVGMLDNNYFFGYEDIDFCLRAKKKGYETVYWPDATIYHEYARTSAKGINIYLIKHIYSIFRYFLKNKIINHYLYVDK